MEPERRPIGYWLKHLDRHIDQAFERALAADGLTRRQWHEAPPRHDDDERDEEV